MPPFKEKIDAKTITTRNNKRTWVDLELPWESRILGVKLISVRDVSSTTYLQFGYNKYKIC